jgi:hypothetical protein
MRPEAADRGPGRGVGKRRHRSYAGSGVLFDWGSYPHRLTRCGPGTGDTMSYSGKSRG